MPVYEYLCRDCNTRTEIYIRRADTGAQPPACPSGAGGHRMQRILSGFARRLTDADRLADAEARYGAEVEAVMGPGPDVASLARRYERLSKDLPPADNHPH